jgi:hypothetical protein
VLLPDYLTVTTATWVLHAAWLAVVAALAAAGWRRAGTAAGEPPAGSAAEAPAAAPEGRPVAGWTTPAPPA